MEENNVPVEFSIFTEDIIKYVDRYIKEKYMPVTCVERIVRTSHGNYLYLWLIPGNCKTEAFVIKKMKPKIFHYGRIVVRKYDVDELHPKHYRRLHVIPFQD